MINNEGIRVEICCWNSECKHYWEDMCLKGWKKNEIMFLDRNGKCRQFEKGRNEAYDYCEESEGEDC